MLDNVNPYREFPVFETENTPKIIVATNHKGIPSIFFTGMDSKDSIDGWSTDELEQFEDVLSEAMKYMKDQMLNIFIDFLAI